MAKNPDERATQATSVYWMLRAKKAEGQEGLTRAEIMQILGISESTLKRALSQLTDDGLVEEVKEIRLKKTPK